MLLQNVIRRRLLSLLQPWLLEEPEFELKLGFIKSLAVVKNLRFDVSVLNQFFDEPAGLFLKEVTVEHLSFRFSGWYTPAFTIEVHGVRVVQSFVKPEEEGYHSRLRTSKYDYSENLTKKLWGLDPEGCDLHGLLERILFSIPSRKKFTTSLSNLILKHCHLEVHNIHVEVHFPILNDMFMCFGEIKELSARPEYLRHRCLLVGLLGAIFHQLRESSCTIDGIGIKVGFKKGDHGDCILLSSDLYILIKLSDLKLADCSLYFPKLIFSFSPDDISLYLAFDKLLHNMYNHPRSARELWKIAASRISHVTVNPRLSLHKFVGIISQWVQYVNAYENLLLIVGYSSDHLLKRSISKMSQNKLILSSARDQWHVISDIGKKLPVEGVALGRRIARHRAAMKVQSDGYKEYSNSSPFNFFRYFLPILALISVIWKVISKIIHSLANIIFLRKRLVQDPDIDEPFGSVIKHPWQRCCFVLNFGKITITVSPINEIQSSVQENLQSHMGIGQSAFLSFCLFIDALLLVSLEDIFEQKYFLSCGQMKVKLSPLKVSPETRTMNLLNSDRRKSEEGINEIESILWIEPAKIFLLSESNATCAEGSRDSHLEKFLGKICLSWKGICNNFKEGEIEYSENPCFLWEIGRSITYPGFKNPNFSFCECGLMLGKLNLTLACPSLPSVFLLLSQIQHALRWEDKGVASVASNSSIDKPQISWITEYECYLKGLMMALLRMLPEKHIQFGVFIDGPCVRFLQGNETHPYGQDINDIVNQNSFDLTFDFHDFEVAAGSPSLFGMTPLTGPLGFDKAESEYIRLEPQPIQIPKPNNKEYTSWGNISFGSYLRLNGLSACLGKSAEKGQIQLFQLKPITIHLSSFREYIYSLSTTMVAFSAAVDITAGGLTVLAFLDEMYMIYQAISSLYYVVSYLYSSIEAIDWVHNEIMNQEVLFAIPESVEANVGETPLTNSMCPFSINGTCRLKSVDLILHKSRKSERVFGFLTSDKLAEQRLPDCGIWITLEQTTIVISCEEGKMDLFTDLSRIMFLIFKYQNPIGKSNDHIVLEDLLSQSVNCLHEISFSSCIFNLYWRLPWNASSPQNEYKTFGISNSGGNVSNLVRDSLLTSSSERSNDEFHSFVKEIGSATDILDPASTSCWLSMNVKVGMVYIGRISLKNDLVRAHRLNKLLSLLSIVGQFQKISWETQGGVIVLETTSLAMASDCYSSYLHCVGSLTLDTQRPNKHIVRTEPSEMRYNLTDENDQETICTSRQAQRGLPDDFAFSLSQFSLVCVLENEPGGFRELVLEVDIHLKLELATTGRKLTFDLSHLSIISQVLIESVEDEMQIPHFSSVISKDSPSHFASGVPPSEFQNFIKFNSTDDASTSRGIPLKRYYKDSFVSEIFHFSHQNDVLKDLRASLSLKRADTGSLHLSEGWCGIGSLSGFDMTLSLSEIQAILSTASSFSGASSQKATGEVDGNHWSTNQEFDNNLEAMIPNGAIVAIRDVSQHMYFTVEGEERNFNVGGTIHYSLVGERALFRVKHCFERRWNSTVLWFSLISLYAKNDKGVPLRLNYSPGSCLIDISCTNDGGSALWRVHYCEGESSKGVTDWDGYNQFAKRTFYLVNKKNDSAVAFIDGVPEFVSKPGNPFKFKILHDLCNFSDVTDPTSNLIMAPPTSLPMDEDRISWLDGKISRIDFKIEKISLNVVHELSDAEDFFPLISGNINNTQLIIQRLATKYRVISTSTAVVHYFHAPRNLWEELLHPVEICFFYRSNFQTRSSEYSSNAVPVNIYFRTKELDISLSELSLDVLLFMIGKLNLSGPYSLRSSMVLANCCKVENQSGLNLLIHFNKERLTIARKQSTSILLRHYDFTKQDSEAADHISIQLADVGSFATSSIRLSLSEAQAAWRTRIMSNEASRTYPGPYLVINISRKTEDGLSVIVSPLIRIHNETGFLLELQFQRPQPKEDEFASVSLKPGDSIDDSMAMFDAMKFSGGVKRALMSLSLGNFLLSFRPEMTKDLINSESSLSAEWSDYIKGGKSVRLSGIFDKLNYRVRKALLVKSDKCSFSTAHCILKSEDVPVANMHFLIQTISRDVPVETPDKSGVMFTNENAPVSLQQQKEIYILPTVRMTNLLHSEIDVLLSETDTFNPIGYDIIGKQAKISSGSTVDFYANPAVIYFIVTLTASNSSSRPVNSGDCVKKLLKQKNDARNLDINLDFGGGNFFAILRLYRGNRGILEAVVFTSYAIKNDTEFPVYVLASKRRPLSRSELDNINSSIPFELGLCLPPKSTRSWFLKSKKVQLKLLEDHTSETLLDLDTLSGLTELSFGKEDGCGIKSIIKLGLSTGPSSGEIAVPSQTVTLVPRYVISNESEECIIVRQCYLQDDMEGTISINSKQQTTLQLKEGFCKKRESSLFEHFIRKHRSASDNSLLYIQIQTNEPGLGWSGPVCIASLGRFFLKFRKQTNQDAVPDGNMAKFAAVHVVEEGSTLVLHFYKPPNMSLPYRIENCLHGLSITYYQKDSFEPEVLGSACSADYVWDDITLPHRLVVRINDSLQLREISLDKVRSWKPFYKLRQQTVLAPRLLLDKRSGDQKANSSELNVMEMAKVGYEIYAEGPTRVLRICERSDSFKRDTVLDWCAKIQIRVSQFAVHLLEHVKQEEDENEPTDFTQIVVARVENLNFSTVSSNQQKYNAISVQHLNLELKWNGAPFASMLRRQQLDYSDSNDSVLKIVFILPMSSSNVKQVSYSSIFLQPMVLNLDEETLMKIASFWRTSLSDSESQRYYFDHFEIHPIKITANFIPGESQSSYSSAQETLRSLLHSVVKVPPIKKMVVELNGVLITHALITVRELFIRCAQHYSWYAMRAIYIAKGSPLLPPDFVSIFDDLASSSLDVFFDPSRGSTMNLPGFTLGTFKFISKCIQGEGFSGTKRYFGDLGKTLRSAGSNVAFAAVAEISDSVLKGAEANGFNGMLSGFHQGILKLAMEPSFLGTALLEGGPDRKITLDRSPGVDELYIEGYIQAMLDTIYRQEYLRVRVIDNQVILKNLPPNHSLINEIMDRVKEFLVSKALIKGDPSTSSHPLRHLRGETEWKIGPTMLTLCEHLFVSFAIRMLRRQANKFLGNINLKGESKDGNEVVEPGNSSHNKEQKLKIIWKWGIGKFVFSGILAYIDGRLCRCIPNPVARRVVSGFVLSYIDQNDDK
ncbi:hypothetical protein L6164_019969 [Bauhinia variegata]|uniref:Uncharacterized protein n=1 Tax=Bauhinia variegata TaxID=167791 RepID=A0ACB9MTM2_BAUVA|nr:hypothetical protein L6164_019969 [Bauhinia variegata]